MTMKKQRLINRILIPTMIALLVLPPLSCLVFWHGAQKYAQEEAVRELETLNSNIVPLLETHFRNTGEMEKEEFYEQVRKVLFQVGQMAHYTSGNAEIMILGSHLQMIYPRDEQQRKNTLALSQLFSENLPSSDAMQKEDAVRLKDSNGETYLVKFYEIPDDSDRIKYLITYCSVSKNSAWVRPAGLLVLAVSCAFVLPVILILCLTARSVSRPIQILCRGAEKIGKGNFEKIEEKFSLKELEELRRELNEMAEKLMQSEQRQRDFFQNVSHELRTPLMSIGGYAQGIEQGVFQVPKEAAHTILEESKRLTGMVNSLLTLSKIENRQQSGEVTAINLRDLIDECIDRIYGVVLDRNLEVSVEIADAGITVYGEEELLGKIFDNLLTNATRHADKKIMIHVKQKGDEAEISISDDGMGIAKEDLPHIFEKCYKGEGGNFGLGLSIARTAASAMNGKLTAANRQEGGAVFTITLQCKR